MISTLDKYRMPTNFDDLIVIRARFADTWEPLNPNVPYVFDDDTPQDQSQGVWARMSINPGAERRRSIARRTYEQLGRVYLQVFAPKDTVSAELWPVAETFAATFRDWQSDDDRIRFDTPEYRLTSANGDEPAMLLVSIPYTAQH